MTRHEVLHFIENNLRPMYGEQEARSIAMLVLSEKEGVETSALLVDPKKETTFEGWQSLVEELLTHRPVQYVLGCTEFYGLKFKVGEGVLIPRPETEELVDWILTEEPLDGQKKVLDVGTGSGCIAGVLAYERADFEVYAADLSQDALTCAAQNFTTLGVKVSLRECDALTSLQETFPEKMDVIVSNPPYVPQQDFQQMERHVRDFEPSMALFVPDEDPLLFYRAIARQGRQMLTQGGRLYFEIYHLYAEQMVAMLEEEGYHEVVVRRDLFGKQRMICGRKR